MKGRRYAAILTVLVLFFLALRLLVAAESAAPNSSITSLSQALWYSLVTMTTVGYGDLYPVTAWGKVIGFVFLILSAGTLTALISFGVSWISGTGLPRLRLKRVRERRIYLFDGRNAAGETLATNILREESGALCVFACDESGETGDGILRVGLSVRETLSCLKTSSDAPTVLHIGRREVDSSPIPDVRGTVNIICESPYHPETLRDGERFFDRAELCASMYWKRYPLKKQECRVLIVGFGKIGRGLLEQALESNIMEPVRVTEYNVFGDCGDFMLDHPAMSDSVSIGVSSKERDSLIVHSEPWNSSPELLASADRIIFCSDSEEENIERYNRLKTFFPTAGVVQLYGEDLTGTELPAFGSDCELYTPEIVLRAGLERNARRLHEIYMAESGVQLPKWEELPAFLRHSNLSSAAHLEEKLRFLLEDDSLTEFGPEEFSKAGERFRSLREASPSLCREIEHARWCRFYSMHNWRYAPERNNAGRRHPLLVPFDELSEAEQAKDDYAWELIEKLNSG